MNGECKKGGPATWHVAVLVLVTLAIGGLVVPRVLNSRVTAAEHAAIGAIMTLNIVEHEYRQKYPEVGFAGTLRQMGSPRRGKCQPSAEQACMIGYDLARADEFPVGGYQFRVASSNGGTEFVAVATPERYGETGVRVFCVTEDKVFRHWDAGRQVSPAEITRDQCRSFQPLP